MRISGEKIWVGVFGAAFVVASLFMPGCGDEDQPRLTGQWQELTALPTGFQSWGLATGADGAPYLAGTDGARAPDATRAVVYRWNGSRLEEAFRSPTPGTSFETVGAGGGAIWAAGETWRGIHEQSTPYVIRYADGRWEEITVPASVLGRGVYQCCPVNRDSCWFVFCAPEGGHVLYSYDNGVWKQHLAGAEANLGLFLTVTENGKAYVYNPRNNGYQSYTILATHDRGATWQKEIIDIPASYNGIGVGPTLAAAGETLYAAVYNHAQTRNGTFVKSSRVFRRDAGAPGSGVYEEVFAVEQTDTSNTSLDSMAFKSAAEGYAAGHNVGARLSGNDWTQEDIYVAGSAVDIQHLAASADAYWALGWYEGSGGRPTLFKSP